MVLIMPGEFMMGSPETEPGREPDEGPQHRVRITRPFYMSATELTKAQWQRLMGTELGFFHGDSLPANVSWDDMLAFFERANRDLPIGVKPMRAPTEAEWEYACRAGSAGPFGFDGPPRHDRMTYNDGDAQSALAGDGDHDFVWNTPPSPEARLKAAPAGATLPNAWGLHEMHGSVGEWTADKYVADAYTGRGDLTVDPFDAGNGDEPRTMRSGDWYSSAEECRCASRFGSGGRARSSRMGARVARGI